MSRLRSGTSPTRLQRRLRLQQARQLFLDGGEPTGVREDILRSWGRARDAYHVDPALARPGVPLGAEGLRQRLARDEWLRLALPVLGNFTMRLTLRDHVLAWFDGEGCMLWIDGDARVAEGLAGIGFRPGTSWAEEAVGTSGPGTALAGGKPIEVFAAEHYLSAWESWSSAAAPVRAPGSPAAAGVVAMTGGWDVRRREAVTFVSAIARAIEERLRAADGVRDAVVRYALRDAQSTGDALVAVDGRGRIVAANDAAARCNAVDAGGLPPALQDAVAEILESRRETRDRDGSARLDAAGAAATVAPVQYDGACVGAIVRIGRAGAALPRSSAPERPAARCDFGAIRGSSPRLRRAVELAIVAARTELPVVLTGEPGTGKELFARAIHAGSGRRERPFLAVNCAAAGAEVLESQLAGDEPGGGTLFLDRVTELTPAAQAALLRVLQEKELEGAGGGAARPASVRVVATARGPLVEEARAGRFRSDLYYRLSVLCIPLPPLRERDDDALLLARGFLGEDDVERRGLTLSADAIDALRAHPWPGNVRELRDALRRAAAVAPGPRITAHDLTLGPTVPAPSRAPRCGEPASPETEPWPG